MYNVLVSPLFAKFKFNSAKVLNVISIYSS
jgi:hypothetical protein